MELNITVGEKLYLDRSIKVNCFVCNPITKQENHIYSYLEGKSNHDAIKGLSIESKSFSSAINGKSRETGGYWSTLKATVTGSNQVLFKIVVNSRSRLNSRNVSMYFLMREGCNISVTNLLKIPDFETTGTHFTEAIMGVIVGAFEVVSVDDVEGVYGFTVNPIFKHQALDTSYQYFLKTEVIRKETVKKPTVHKIKVKKVTGEVVSLISRKKRHRRINL